MTQNLKFLSKILIFRTRTPVNIPGISHTRKCDSFFTTCIFAIYVIEFHRNFPNTIIWETPGNLNIKSRVIDSEKIPKKNFTIEIRLSKDTIWNGGLGLWKVFFFLGGCQTLSILGLIRSPLLYWINKRKREFLKWYNLLNNDATFKQNRLVSTWIFNPLKNWFIFAKNKNITSI